MDYLLSLLAQSQRAAEYALDLKGRSLSLRFCIVADNRDPLGLRRLKVVTENAALTSTDWLARMVLVPGFDPPLPAIGTSVICAFIDGNPHDGVWLGPCHNDTNLADDQQQNPILDNTQTIPGDHKLSIGGNSTETIKGNHIHTVNSNETRLVKQNHESTTEQNETRTVLGTLSNTVRGQEIRRTDQNLVVSAGTTITLVTDSGATLILTAAGIAILKDAYGNTLVLGGASGGGGYASDLEWSIAGDINLRSSGKVKINNKEICVVTGQDDEGDRFEVSGQ